MSDVENQLTALRQKASQITKARITAEHRKELAAKDFERQQEFLREEYGVTSVAEAKALLQQKEDRVQGLVAEISAKLDELEAAP